MRVLCVGEMLTDIVVCPVSPILLKNDTRFVEQIQFLAGGDSNNNAVDLVKLGHSVIYMGRIGCDILGDFVLQQARKAGIDMRFAVRSDSVPQAKSLILTGLDGNRTFLQCPGTSDEFCFEDCDLSVLDQVDLLQIGGALHLPRFDGDGAARLLRAAKERSVITSMDITTDRSGRWQGILDPCYPYLDYFLPSIEQAAKVSGQQNPEDIAGFFLSRGVKNVAVKNGSQGSYFQNADTAFYAGIYHGLNIAETTGAGDAFCAGFLTGVSLHLDPESCVTLGTACSSFAIQAVGATTGMRDLETVQEFIRTHPPLEIKKLF